ncbi:MAG: DUF533 domain-containing protein [Paracoccaceae bacterium]|nr:DUF533 domain-containing protein [Paracoccaceae bacterium]MDE3123346.1 DUF533 domain-containing protein [Paracoccaceae bacterium]MDE3239872.1 DUF533 domain-containing protein [Paracoccaceae bacterium]
MSFLNTLATMAVGFAAAKGIEQVQKMGGVAGLQEMLQNASAPGGLADSLGGMAQQMGIPGGAQMVQNVMSEVQQMTSAGTGATQAGLGGLFAALGGAGTAVAASGAGMMGEMMSAMTKGTPVSDAAEENAKLMIRAMIQAAKADGQIDPDEQARILDHLKNAQPDEIAFVKEQLAAPLDIAGLVADAQGAVKAQVFSAAVMAITIDTEAERAFLAQLAQGLGLDPATRDTLLAAQGRAPLGV